MTALFLASDIMRMPFKRVTLLPCGMEQEIKVEDGCRLRDGIDKTEDGT